MHYFNTGFPCEHALLVSFSHGYKFLIHQRWSLDYEAVLQDMEENSRNQRITSLHE
jgi:hypothetical protein